MFTVKHIDDYGNESLFSAATVRVIRRDDCVAEGSSPGVIVEGVVDQDFIGVHYPFRSPAEPRENTSFSAAIFVMNENGATVAHYRL